VRTNHEVHHTTPYSLLVIISADTIPFPRSSPYSGRQAFGCDHCGEAFPTLEAAANHESNECEKRPKKWGCEHCGEMFHIMEEATEHETKLCEKRPQNEQPPDPVAAAMARLGASVQKAEIEEAEQKELETGDINMSTKIIRSMQNENAALEASRSTSLKAAEELAQLKAQMAEMELRLQKEKGELALNAENEKAAALKEKAEVEMRAAMEVAEMSAKMAELELKSQKEREERDKASSKEAAELKASLAEKEANLTEAGLQSTMSLKLQLADEKLGLTNEMAEIKKQAELAAQTYMVELQTLQQENDTEVQKLSSAEDARGVMEKTMRDAETKIDSLEQQLRNAEEVADSVMIPVHVRETLERQRKQIADHDRLTKTQDRELKVLHTDKAALEAMSTTKATIRKEEENAALRKKQSDLQKKLCAFEEEVNQTRLESGRVNGRMQSLERHVASVVKKVLVRAAANFILNKIHADLHCARLNWYVNLHRAVMKETEFVHAGSLGQGSKFLKETEKIARDAKRDMSILEDKLRSANKTVEEFKTELETSSKSLATKKMRTRKGRYFLKLLLARRIQVEYDRRRLRAARSWFRNTVCGQMDDREAYWSKRDAGLTTDLEEAREMVKAQKESVNDMKTELAEYDPTGSKARKLQQLSIKDAKIADLQAQGEIRQSMFKRHEAEMTVLNEEIEALNKRDEFKTEELRKFELTVEQLQAVIDAGREQRTTFRDDFDEVQVSLEETLSKREKQWKKSFAEKEADRVALEVALNDEKANKVNLYDENKDLRAKYLSAHHAAKMAAAEQLDLERIVEELTGQIDAQNRVVTQLRKDAPKEGGVLSGMKMPAMPW